MNNLQLTTANNVLPFVQTRQPDTDEERSAVASLAVKTFGTGNVARIDNQTGLAVMTTNPVAVVKTDPSAVAVAIRAALPSIGRIAKERGENNLLRFFAKKIYETAKVLGVALDIDKNAYITIAADVLADFSYLNEADIAIVLARGRKGQYGQVLKANSGLFYQWFARYADERATIAESESIAEAERLRAGRLHYYPTDSAEFQEMAMYHPASTSTSAHQHTATATADLREEGERQRNELKKTYQQTINQ